MRIGFAFLVVIFFLAATVSAGVYLLTRLSRRSNQVDPPN